MEALSEVLPAYELIEEPYRVLEEEGYEFSDPPSVEDYERQLRRSIESLAAAPTDVLLDRCPLDFVAYLQPVDDDFDLAGWMDDLREGIASLDLIVFVPVEQYDRIALPAHEDRQLRRRVAELLRSLVLDDIHGFGATSIEVIGNVDARMRQVVHAMQRS